MKYAKVRGHEGLVKDPQSGAVINTDTNAYEAAKSAKKRILEEKKKYKELEERMARLEAIIENISK